MNPRKGVPGMMTLIVATVVICLGSAVAHVETAWTRSHEVPDLLKQAGATDENSKGKGDFAVNDDIPLHQFRPAIARSGSGDFVITWLDDRFGFNIYAQRYNSAFLPLGANFNVNDNEGDVGVSRPAIGMDGSGNFVIAWTDFRYGEHNIWAQRYNSEGTALGSNFVVNEDPFGDDDQRSPAIAVDGSGGFVIAWEDDRNGSFPDNPDIYAQRFGSDGSSLDSNFKANDDVGSAGQWSPSIATDGSGNFTITWQDERDGIPGIYAQRYESSGSPSDSNFRVSDLGSSASNPAIAVDASGKFVITWEDDRNGNWDIYAQRYDSSGDPFASNIRVNDDAGIEPQRYPAVAMASPGKFVITWGDERDLVSHIYAQRYTFFGGPQGSNLKVYGSPEYTHNWLPAIAMDAYGNFVITWEEFLQMFESYVLAQSHDWSGTLLWFFKVFDGFYGGIEHQQPAIAADTYGRFVITWHDDRNRNWDIYARRYPGQDLGSNFKVNDDPGTAGQVGAAVAMDTSAYFVISWKDNRDGNNDIYAQRYDTSGIGSGPNFKVNDDAGSAGQSYPTVAMDGSGNFVISWQDNRNGSSDIYGQRYHSSGTPLGSNFKVNDAGNPSEHASVAMDISGKFAITWQQYDGNWNIYGQSYNSSGSPLGSNFKVNDDFGSAEQTYPSAAIYGSAKFVVAWQDNRDGNSDVYAQRYEFAGLPLGPNFKVNDDATTVAQVYPAIASHAADNFIITWQDYRSGNYDIYAQRYSLSGNPLDGNFLVSDPVYASFTQECPAVASANSDIFFAWMDDRGTENQKTNIYATVNLVQPGYEGPVWYVCTSGNDTTGSGSPQFPLATIQKGINTAEDTDTVLVCPGVYYENINFLGKGIVVGSEFILDGDTSKIAQTIVDGSQPSDPDTGSVVLFCSGEDSTSKLIGFTLRNGSGTHVASIGDPTATCGGGICCYLRSSPIISNNIIDGDSSAHGGGIGCERYCSPKIINNQIISNTALWTGGGIYCYESAPIITGNEIVGNTAVLYYGGGIYCQDTSDAQITNNVIDGNASGLHGGGIDIEDSSPLVRKNNILRNTAVREGGGIYCRLVGTIVYYPMIDSNTVANNHSLNGAGIACWTYNNINCGIRIAHNTISGNTADTAGGGIFCQGYAYPQIDKNTLDSNTALQGGGMHFADDAHPVVKNNIVSNSGGEGMFCLGNSDPGISYNDVWNSSEDNFSGCAPGLGDTSWGVNYNGTPCDSFHNIIREPLFADPGNHDYHLTEDSPCIDAGDPSNPKDPDSTIADIGRYYYHRASITVISPNGGEIWEGGGQYYVRWSSQDFSGNVRIDYSINSGTSFDSVVVPSYPNTGEYLWTVPYLSCKYESCSFCRVRVCDAENCNPADISDADFTIYYRTQEAPILGQVGLIGLVILLVATAVWMIRKRQFATNRNT